MNEGACPKVPISGMISSVSYDILQAQYGKSLEAVT